MNGPVAVAKLVSMLLLAIAGYTGFGVPKQHPEISFLSQSELQVRFCGWPCPIHAFFPPGSTIYLEQGLNVFHDPASESILVHELTHWMQQANLPHPTAQSCQEWLDREYQAFDVQYRWLRDASSNIGIFSIEMAKLNHGPLVASCPSVDSSQPTGLSDSALAKSPPSRAGTLAGYGG